MTTTRLLYKYFGYCLSVVLCIFSHQPTMAAPPATTHVTATPSATLKHIAELLTNKGVQVQSAVAFYQAGLDCHRRMLKVITWYVRGNGIFFFFDDALDNCHLAMLPFALPGQKVFPPPGNCMISDTQSEKMFTPWFLDSLKNYDATQQLNPVAKIFIETTLSCLKPITEDALLSLLAEAKTEKQNARGE